MEVLLGAMVVLAWFAVVIWGAANLVIEAKRKNDWEKVGIAVLSAATVGGPLLFLMPEHVFFGIHTMGFGGVLALISAFVIFASIMRKANWLP
jgi:hypothetical protein